LFKHKFIKCVISIHVHQTDNHVCTAYVLAAAARSSLFLSLLISAAFAGACGGHRLAQRSTGSIIALGVSVGGLATLLEKKSRRMELALYVLSRWVWVWVCVWGGGGGCAAGRGDGAAAMAAIVPVCAVFNVYCFLTVLVTCRLHAAAKEVAQYPA
jgi:hypothetical protein